MSVIKIYLQLVYVLKILTTFVTFVEVLDILSQIFFQHQSTCISKIYKAGPGTCKVSILV